MVRTCQMFWVELRGASWRDSPSDSPAGGTAIVSECVLWPFALHRSSEQYPPAQLRSSVAKRFGSAESYLCQNLSECTQLILSGSRYQVVAVNANDEIEPRL